MNSKERVEKIKLLKDILQGRKKLNELFPSTFLIKINGDPGGTVFYKDGKEITQEQYADYHKTFRKPVKYIVTTSTNENE